MEKKTDLEKFKELYDSVGVDYQTRTGLGGSDIVMLLTAQLTNKVDGYYDFYTEIVFDKDGKFKEQCIWE